MFKGCLNHVNCAWQRILSWIYWVNLISTIDVGYLKEQNRVSNTLIILKFIFVDVMLQYGHLQEARMKGNMKNNKQLDIFNSS